MTPAPRLTPRALRDLDDIADYTRRVWGDGRMQRYLRELADRIAWLANNPQAGRLRNDIDKEYRCFPQGQHLVFYIIGPEGGIAVIGIPHQAMDVKRHLRRS